MKKVQEAHGPRNLEFISRSVDRKDSDTGRHSIRVAHAARAIARCAGWSREDQEKMYQAGLYHDVGKLIVDDEVLKKPGKLEPEEFELVKAHPEIGAAMVSRDLNVDQQFWILHHHERPDGEGYPDGLTVHSISEGAAILCLADCWDVMTTDRPYKKAKSKELAIAEVTRLCGSQFMHVAVRALEDCVREGST